MFSTLQFISDTPIVVAFKLMNRNLFFTFLLRAFFLLHTMPAIARSIASSNNTCSSLDLPVHDPSSSFLISVGIFKPRPPFTVNHLIFRLSSLALSFHSTGFVRSAILKSISGNSASPSVAVYSIWDKGYTPEDGLCDKHPKVNAYEKEVSSLAYAVDVSWYQVSCWDSKDRRTAGAGLNPAQLSKGDVVHLRKITLANDHHHGPALNPQEILPYSCLAITKAYFHQVEGLLSCTFYRSLDAGVHGRLAKMMGLGVWQSMEAAHAFLNSSPAECYWRSLGAKLGFRLFEVILVTTDSPTVNIEPVACNNRLTHR